MDDLANHWRATQAAANQYFESNASLSFKHPQFDVMGAGYRPVAGAIGDSDFKPALRKLEFGVIS